jgi:DNA repair photolyase
MDCTVFLAPILPMLTDHPDELDELVREVAAARATAVLYTPLYLATGVRDVFFHWLRREQPGLLRDYANLYSEGSETPLECKSWLSGQIRAVIARYSLPDPDDSIEDKFALNGRRPVHEPTQAALF